MLPGKAYTPEDILRILKSRIWLIVVPVAVLTAIGATVVRGMPDFYKAETVILVVPQRVPESFVRSTVTSRLGDRLRTITPMIQSRTRLERIIKDLDLYPEERKVRPMEDVVAGMRASIEVETIRDDAFKVRYIGRDPRKVMEVTNRLASFYINESVSDRQAQAAGTDDFLESQLVVVKQRLEDNEKRLEAYRREHALELPSQLESNLQQVRSAQAQLQSQAEIVARLQERRESQRQILSELEAASDESPLVQVSGPSSTAKQLASAEAALNALLGRGLKAGHPDVDQATRTVRDLRSQLAAETADSDPGQPVPGRVESPRQRRVTELRGEIADLERQIAKAQAYEEQLHSAGDVAQKRVDVLPTRESELTELMRDYSTMDGTYKSLLAKKEESKIASNLEQQQIGEQYKLLDPAPLPERPFSPDRTRLTSTAAAAGLALGLIMVGFIEYRDWSFRRDEDVAAVLGVPVLATVPLMRSEAEHRRQVWRRVAIHAACSGVVGICLAIAVRAIVR